MHHNHVCSCLRHLDGLLSIEHVWCCEQVELMRERDHFDFLIVSHAGFFEILPEDAVDETNGGKVLYTNETQRAKVRQELRHRPERIRCADAGKDWSGFNDG